MDVVKDIAADIAINEHLQKFLGQFQQAINDRIAENLKRRGFTFKDDLEATTFIDERVTVATVEDHPFLNLVYLDFVDFDNLGTFLFAYNTEVKQEFVDGVLKLSIG
jgi:hypothetical protein